MEFIIAGDFNQHDQLWGGDHVGIIDCQGEAEGIIDMMADMDLQSSAPRRVATWHSRDDTRETTIDVILFTPELTNEVCRRNRAWLGPQCDPKRTGNRMAKPKRQTKEAMEKN